MMCLKMRPSHSRRKCLRKGLRGGTRIELRLLGAQVRATDGDTRLGGEDIDARLVSHFLQVGPGPRWRFLAVRCRDLLIRCE